MKSFFVMRGKIIVLLKKSVCKSFAKFTGKHLCQSLCFKKETLAQVFSCESCEIYKKNLFTEHVRSTASAVYKLVIAILVQRRALEVFYKAVVLNVFAKFTEKQLCQSLLLNEVGG